VSKASFPESGVPVVYVANGMDFPDALAGAAAAGTLGGPVLLTSQSALPSSVKSELSRLAPKRVVVLGGTGVVSATVESAIGALVNG
ncbi:cell wall-binding repeat-containing protein, partial [Microbacterium sp. NPDC058345]|uniref:cell wall-binding repeat-containing protein n=1 Tax=Microbacterium sp. NPDC058345 TaxID=3346455 RepID=UPI00365868CC